MVKLTGSCKKAWATAMGGEKTDQEELDEEQAVADRILERYR